MSFRNAILSPIRLAFQNLSNRKIVLIIFILLTILVSILYYIFFGQYKKNCSSFSDEYYKWFPYHEKDQLIFSNNSNNITYTVTSFESFHTDKYQSNLKCGCCEDNIRVILANENDTIKINFQNLDYNKSCLGSYFEINDNYVDLTKVLIDSFNRENKFRMGKYLFEKQIGISEINYLDSIYKFQKRVESNSVMKVKKRNCN